MKWKLLVALGVIVVLLVAGCGGTSTETEEMEPKEIPAYQVYLDLAFEENMLMNRYDVDVYFGDEEVGSIKHGESFTLMLDSVQEGEYPLTFYEAGDESVTGSTTVKIKEDTTFRCMIHAKGSEIRIDEVKTLSGIEGNSLVLPDLSGQNLQETLKSLEEAGFVNVSAIVEGEDSIWDSSNWTIVSQNIDAGTEIDKNDEVILTCIKTTAYVNSYFTNVTLADAKEKAQELGYSIVAYENIHNFKDMTSKVNSMSSEDLKIWNVIEAEVASSVERQIAIRLDYGASSEVPSVIGETMSSAIETLNKANIYNIEGKNEDGSLISDDSEWVVIGQSVEEGSSMEADERMILTCVLSADIEELEAAEKNAELEAIFPVEYAKRAAVVAITNSRAVDVFDESGNYYDVEKFHSYSDTSGNFYDYYLSVISWGNWKAIDDNTWHADSLVLEDSFGNEIMTSLDVTSDSGKYSVKNIEGTSGSNDYGQMVAGDSNASLYLTVSPEMIEDSREENRLDSHHSWVIGQFSSWDGSHKAMVEIIKENLNDEKSFDHIETTYLEIFNEDYMNDINGRLKSANINRSVEIGDLWITTEFSAKNAFNATVKNTAYGIASFSEDRVIIVAIE